MTKLLKYMKSFGKECVLGPLFKLLEALLELFVPLVVAEVIDNGIGNGDGSYIVKMCLLMVGLGFVGLAFSITAQFFAAKAAVGFAAKIRHALFEHIGKLTYTELDELGTSTLITRMTSDINQVQSGTNLTLRLLLRSPFVVFGAMIMAFTIDTKAAMIFVYVTAILLVVVFGIMLGCIPLYKKVQQKLDSVTRITRENLTGVRVIRAFCREDAETESFIEKNDELSHSQRFAGKISALMNPVTYIIINCALIILIHTGSVRVAQGELTTGQVVALYNYMSQILVELIKLANLIISITKSIACGNRIQSVLDIVPSGSKSEGICPDGSDKEYAVEFDHASLLYKNAASCALTDMDFAVKKGETIGIIGGTGSGKSSLVNMIPRFYEAHEGCVRVNGTDVREISDEALRSMIGIVPQKAELFKGTIRDNLRWGNESAEDEALIEAAKLAQAGDVLNAKGGLDGEIEQSGRNLSGGQRQRLTIARALVRKPEILILDDSASALDFATDAALRKSLRSLDYRPTVFIVSQRTSSIMHADRIIVLDDGEIAGSGTHDELLESCEVYKEIYSSQFKKEAV
ncbi:MAG: ABC transporter ATP-binding protein [Huintestinicola sp.]